MSDMFAPLSVLVTRVQGGGTPSRAVSMYWHGPIPWASVKDLTKQTFEMHDTVEHISPKGLSSSSASLIPAGIPIVATRMAVGKTVIPTVDVAINQDLKALYPASDVDSRYLTHILQFIEPRVDAVSVGSTVRGISVDQLMRFRVFSPPLSEQRRIAEILDTLDDQIRATEKVVAKLRVTRNGLMTDLFTCGIEPNGRLRDPIANTADFKTSGAGSMPKSWRADSVAGLISSGHLADIQDGNHGELHPKRNDFVSEGIPFLMARDIAGGTIDFDHCYRIRREQYARLRVGFSKPGDVLLSHKGTIGEVAMVPEDAQEVMLTPQVTYYRPAHGLSSEFLFYYMQSGQFQRALRMIAGQSTRDYVGISTQRRLLYIPVPDISEQRRIVSVARAVDNRIKNEKLQLSTLRLAKVGLSSDLLTGRVRVPMEAGS
jgi:type I restriction enzyme S subunit